MQVQVESMRHGIHCQYMYNDEKLALSFRESSMLVVFVLAVTVIVVGLHLAAICEGFSGVLREDKGRIEIFIKSNETYLDITPLSNSFSANKETIDLIVSHCTEDLKWIDALARRIPLTNVYIYEKCNKNLNTYRQANRTSFSRTCEEKLHAHNQFCLPCMQHLEATVLPNRGREGATWLHHMLRRDILFSRWNIFLQGQFEAKGFDLERGLHATRGDANFEFIDLSKFRHRKKFRCYHWPFCPEKYFAEWEFCKYHARYKSSNTACEEAQGSLRGEFIVTGDAIQRVFSSGMRNKMMELLGVLNRAKSPKMGHFLERMWIEILNVTELETEDDINTTSSYS